MDFKEVVYCAKEVSEDHPKVVSKTPFYGPNQFPKQLPELKKDI